MVRLSASQFILPLNDFPLSGYRLAMGMHRGMLGIPDGWTAAQVAEIDAEAHAFAKQQVLARLG